MFQWRNGTVAWYSEIFGLYRCMSFRFDITLWYTPSFKFLFVIILNSNSWDTSNPMWLKGFTFSSISASFPKFLLVLISCFLYFRRTWPMLLKVRFVCNILRNSVSARARNPPWSSTLSYTMVGCANGHFKRDWYLNCSILLE